MKRIGIILLFIAILLGTGFFFFLKETKQTKIVKDDVQVTLYAKKQFGTLELKKEVKNVGKKPIEVYQRNSCDTGLYGKLSDNFKEYYTYKREPFGKIQVCNEMIKVVKLQPNETLEEITTYKKVKKQTEDIYFSGGLVVDNGNLFLSKDSRAINVIAKLKIEKE